MQKRIGILAFDWNKFVRGHVFEQVLISAAGVPITYLLVSKPEIQPEWLILNPTLSVLCFVFAFLRVWKSLEEEMQTPDISDILGDYFKDSSAKLDEMILPFYVFTLFLMPFFSIAFQFFVGIIALFYIVSAIYNLIFLSALPRYYETSAYNKTEIQNCRVKRYYIRRQILDVACIVFIFAFGIGAWLFAINRNYDGALATGFVCIISLLVIEGLLEPIINIEFHFYEGPSSYNKLNIFAVKEAESISDDDRDRLKEIHNEAFEEEERHFDVEYFLKNTGKEGCLLNLLHTNDTIIGYLYYQVMASRKIAVLWYMAIDPEWRDHGFGKAAIRHILNELESYPSPIQYVYLEARSPKIDAGIDDIDRRRISLYRSLGAYWIRAIDYTVPSHPDKSRFINYELMFFPIGGQIDTEQVKNSIRYFAEDTYVAGNPRAVKFEKSLVEMYIQPPAEKSD